VYEKAGNEEGLSREKRVITMLTEWRDKQRAAEQKQQSESEPAATE
jgi:hypothetical protein